MSITAIIATAVVFVVIPAAGVLSARRRSGAGRVVAAALTGLYVLLLLAVMFVAVGGEEHELGEPTVVREPMTQPPESGTLAPSPPGGSGQ